MEQFFNTGWLVANFGAFYIALKAKLMIVQTTFLGIDIEALKNLALVLGIISTILFIVYNIIKSYHQILKTKILKKENGIKKLFTFVNEEDKNK